MTTTKTLRTCLQGHQYYKSISCPVCPICESKKAAAGFLSSLAAPARRALENRGIHSLQELAQYSEKEILALHGMGKTSIPKLRAALTSEGLSFRK